MKNMNRFEWLILTGILITLLFTTLSLYISGESTQQSPMEGKSTISIKAEGIAVRKIDEGRERKSLAIDLILVLGEKGKRFIPIKSVEGTITIDGTSYDVVEAKGIVLPQRNVVILKISHHDRSINLVLCIRYFWMGSSLYAIRGSGVLKDMRTIVLFRGTARIS